MYKKGNRKQGVLRGKKLEQAEWYGCSKQRRKRRGAAYPREGKAQQSGTLVGPPESAAKEEGKQREMRRIFKVLREV